jgi:hypothetical protein
MKKIIDRVTYNTKTAIPMFDIEREEYSSDFRYERSTVYRTRKGNYFLAGHGGAMSRWAKRWGENTWGGGEGIHALTRDEALDLAKIWADIAQVFRMRTYNRSHGE